MTEVLLLTVILLCSTANGQSVTQEVPLQLGKVACNNGPRNKKKFGGESRIPFST